VQVEFLVLSACVASREEEDRRPIKGTAKAAPIMTPHTTIQWYAPIVGTKREYKRITCHCTTHSWAPAIGYEN
jgi:hypothetical protein